MSTKTTQPFQEDNVSSSEPCMSSSNKFSANYFSRGSLKCMDHARNANSHMSDLGANICISKKLDLLQSRVQDTILMKLL